jgi:23S rRNA (uracil-5-)-methyltransferase RumA
MDYTFGDERKGGEMTLGMHKRGSFLSVLTTDRCLLVDGDFNKLLAATLAFSKEMGYTAYNKKSHMGLLRNLVVRKGARTGELLANLVTSSQGEIDGNALTRALLSLSLDGRLAGVLHTINDRAADFVYCDELRTLFGNSHYMEEMLGLKFKVNAFSFFQTNAEAAERLYETALSWAGALEGETALDLYCGAGTITQALALKAARAVGVDMSPDAVASATANAKLNGLGNCSFIEGDVSEALDRLSQERPGLIVVDPPRAGIHRKALEKIIGFGARRLIYISCNPLSLAGNLSALREAYRVVRLQAFDNFPHTAHVECMALMTSRALEGE